LGDFTKRFLDSILLRSRISGVVALRQNLVRARLWCFAVAAIVLAAQLASRVGKRRAALQIIDKSGSF
jgi:hypothetical protein